MRFENQSAKVAFLEEELRKFGDNFFPTVAHLIELEAVTDTLPVGQFAEIQRRMLALGRHVRSCIAEMTASPNPRSETAYFQQFVH